MGGSRSTHGTGRVIAVCLARQLREFGAHPCWSGSCRRSLAVRGCRVLMSDWLPAERSSPRRWGLFGDDPAIAGKIAPCSTAQIFIASIRMRPAWLQCLGWFGEVTFVAPTGLTIVHNRRTYRQFWLRLESGLCWARSGGKWKRGFGGSRRRGCIVDADL